MNSLGRHFRISIFGESHGPSVGVLIDGCPAGLPINAEEFEAELSRRRPGKPGTTARIEADEPRIQSGVHNGRTTGGPIAILFENGDVDSSSYEKIKDTPRPGHADLTARTKFGGFNDPRGGGQFSGRLTVGLVAAGAIAKKLIAPVSVSATLETVGGDENVEAAVENAVAGGDSVGGIVQCKATGLPAGVGEPFFDGLESAISHAVFAIPGIKAIEFGAGFEAGRMHGSEFNDPILNAEGTTATNHAGGINGGISNGNELTFRVAVRPTATIGKPQATVDLTNGEATQLEAKGRHDACIALRVPVIVEAACAIALCDLMIAAQKTPRVMGN
jgi:chorismate synthase